MRSYLGDGLFRAFLFRGPPLKAYNSLCLYGPAPPRAQSIGGTSLVRADGNSREFARPGQSGNLSFGGRATWRDSALIASWKWCGAESEPLRPAVLQRTPLPSINSWGFARARARYVFGRIRSSLMGNPQAGLRFPPEPGICPKEFETSFSPKGVFPLDII